MKNYNKATLWVILASATLTVMAGAIIAPVLNLMGEGLNVEPSSARILITTHSIFVALFSPLFGVLIDRIGPKKPLVIGLALFCVSGGTGLFINDYWLLLISRAVLGIGVAAIFTSITVLVFNLYKQGTERNKVMGYRASSQSIGGITWPLLGGFLGTFSWHYPFAIYFIGVPLCLLTILFIPETQQESVESADEKEPLYSGFSGILQHCLFYMGLSSWAGIGGQSGRPGSQFDSPTLPSIIGQSRYVI